MSLTHCDKFQFRQNSRTGHCYVISFGAGKRLDVIITIMKRVQCSVSCPPGKQKVGGQKISARSACKIVPPPSKPWRRPWRQQHAEQTKKSISNFRSNYSSNVRQAK